LGRRCNKPHLTLNSEERKKLEKISASRTAPRREIERSRILLGYADGEKEIVQIASEVGVSRPTVYKCIEKALSMGVEAGLKDTFHRPFEPVITPEAKAWVTHLSCSKPKDYGYAAELWTRKSLAKHIRENCQQAGHPSLSRAATATVQRILKEDVLLVYQEVSLMPEKGDRKVYTVSVDEKPGVQAIENTAPDLPPVPGKHKEWSRDHEYIRHGTLSILASLDLQDGHVIGRVEERHRSIEFIGLLKDLDASYPPDATIRIVLDNHSAHTSKETRAYLVTRPNRFHYVHTPTHGSWLNIVETLFGKMARTFLKQIRVKSKQELKERILKGIAEINAAPVVHRWKKFDLLEVV
jgi:transposase